MPRGIKLLRHQKYAKMLSQSSKGPFTQSHTHQKNSGTLFCVQYFVFEIKSSFMNTKPLRFRFGTASLPEIHLFF